MKIEDTGYYKELLDTGKFKQRVFVQTLLDGLKFELSISSGISQFAVILRYEILTDGITGKVNLSEEHINAICKNELNVKPIPASNLVRYIDKFLEEDAIRPVKDHKRIFWYNPKFYSRLAPDKLAELYNSYFELNNEPEPAKATKQVSGMFGNKVRNE